MATDSVSCVVTLQNDVSRLASGGLQSSGTVKGRYCQKFGKLSNEMDRLHDTRAPFWTGFGTGSRARQVQDPNGGSRVSFRFWSHKKTIPSSSLSFLAAKKTLYLYPFSVVRTSTQSIKTKQQSVPKLWSWNLVEVAWPSTCSACAADSSWWIYRWRAL